MEIAAPAAVTELVLRRVAAVIAAMVGPAGAGRRATSRCRPVLQRRMVHRVGAVRSAAIPFGAQSD